MKDILLITHDPESTTGTTEEWCNSRGLSFETLVAPTLNNEFDPRKFDQRSLIIFGGDMEVWETTKHPWLLNEKNLVHLFIANGRKIFGICLGSQLLAEALGAKVSDMGEWEFGWFPVQFTNGKTLCPMHCHSSQFSLPPVCKRTASDRFDTEQGFISDDGLNVGFQFHTEIDQTRIDHILSGLKHTPSGKAQSPAEISKGFEAHHRALKEWFFTELDQWWTFAPSKESKRPMR